jgi:hypothetical protein
MFEAGCDDIKHCALLLAEIKSDAKKNASVGLFLNMPLFASGISRHPCGDHDREKKEDVGTAINETCC